MPFGSQPICGLRMRRGRCRQWLAPTPFPEQEGGLFLSTRDRDRKSSSRRAEGSRAQITEKMSNSVSSWVCRRQYRRGLVDTIRQELQCAVQSARWQQAGMSVIP